LLAGMLLPMFARMISEKASKSLSELALLSAKLLILPAILIAIISWVYPVEILSFMYPNKIDIISPDTFRYLMISFIATCSIYVFGTALTAAKELKWLNILATTTLVSNLVLNAILIPTHGSDGAALATLLTQAVFALGCFYKAKTSFNIHITSKLTLSISIYTGLLIGLFWLGRQFFETPFVHISVGVVCAVVFVFASGLFNLNMLKSLVRRKTRNS
ncbi:MAG: O-antigen/teichoic acid export membrane protein, partial [Bacteroidia bacterium]